MEIGKVVGRRSAENYPICKLSTQSSLSGLDPILNDYKLQQEFSDSFSAAFKDANGCMCHSCCQSMKCNLPMIDVPNSYKFGETAGKGANSVLPQVCDSCSPLKIHDIAMIVCTILCVDPIEREEFIRGFKGMPNRNFCPCSERFNFVTCLKFLVFGSGFELQFESRSRITKSANLKLSEEHQIVEHDASGEEDLVAQFHKDLTSKVNTFFHEQHFTNLKKRTQTLYKNSFNKILSLKNLKEHKVTNINLLTDLMNKSRKQVNEVARSALTTLQTALGIDCPKIRKRAARLPKGRFLYAIPMWKLERFAKFLEDRIDLEWQVYFRVILETAVRCSELALLSPHSFTLSRLQRLLPLKSKAGKEEVTLIISEKLQEMIMEFHKARMFKPTENFFGEEITKDVHESIKTRQQTDQLRRILKKHSIAEFNCLSKLCLHGYRRSVLSHVYNTKGFESCQRMTGHREAKTTWKYIYNFSRYQAENALSINAFEHQQGAAIRCGETIEIEKKYCGDCEMVIYEIGSECAKHAFFYHEECEKICCSLSERQPFQGLNQFLENTLACQYIPYPQKARYCQAHRNDAFFLIEKPCGLCKINQGFNQALNESCILFTNKNIINPAVEILFESYLESIHPLNSSQFKTLTKFLSQTENGWIPFNLMTRKEGRRIATACHELMKDTLISQYIGAVTTYDCQTRIRENRFVLKHSSLSPSHTLLIDPQSYGNGAQFIETTVKEELVNIKTFVYTAFTEPAPRQQLKDVHVLLVTSRKIHRNEQLYRKQCRLFEQNNDEV